MKTVLADEPAAFPWSPTSIKTAHTEKFNGDRGIFIFPVHSADHEQDWRPYPVDPYSAIRDDHTYLDL